MEFVSFGTITPQREREYLERKERVDAFFSGIKEGRLGMVIPVYYHKNYLRVEGDENG